MGSGGRGGSCVLGVAFCVCWLPLCYVWSHLIFSSCPHRSLLCLPSYHSSSPCPSSPPSLCLGCVGTFCGSHSLQGLRPSFTDCSTYRFSAPPLAWSRQLWGPAVFGNFHPGMESTGPLFLGVPTGDTGFCNSLHHYSELGLGGRAQGSFSFTPQSQSLLLLSSPPSRKPGKVYLIWECFFLCF